MPRDPSAVPTRLAEHLFSLSLAIDSGMGMPQEWVMKACLLGMRLGKILGLEPKEQTAVFHVILLRHVGCSSTAAAEARVFGDELEAHRVFPFAGDESKPLQSLNFLLQNLGKGASLFRRSELLLRFFSAQGALDLQGLSAEHCEVAQRVSQAMDLSAETFEGLGQAYERWDGKGQPQGVRGEAISVAARVASFSLDVSLFYGMGGTDFVEAMVRDRAGRFHDPTLSQTYLDHAANLTAALETTTLWEDLLESEPRPWKLVDGSEALSVFQLFADFADLKSPWFLGASRRIFDLVTQAGKGLLSADELVLTQQAALVQGLGRVGVSASIWGKGGPLSQAEREAVRLYPHLTQRAFARSTSLGPVGNLAAEVQERLDGSGYHRGLKDQTLPSRLLCAVHVFCALTSDRPHRPALSSTQAGSEMADQVRTGLLDREAVRAVLSAVGQAKSIPLPRPPFDLTPREIDVLRQIAKGLSNKEMAKKLGIAEKTAGHHIERLYEKIHVKTRAGATLFAVKYSLH